MKLGIEESKPGKLVINLIMSVQRNGSGMLTRLPPKLKVIRGTQLKDFYIQAGEPIGLRHICKEGLAMVYNYAPRIMSQRLWQITIKDCGEYK